MCWREKRSQEVEKSKEEAGGAGRGKSKTKLIRICSRRKWEAGDMEGPVNGTLVDSPEGLRSLEQLDSEGQEEASTPCKHLPSKGAWGWWRSPQKADCLRRRLSKQGAVAKGTAWEETCVEMLSPTFAAMGGGRGPSASSNSALLSPPPDFGPWKVEILPPLTVPQSDYSLARRGHVGDCYKQ